MFKKVALPLLVLVGLLTVSFFVAKKMRPTTGNANPLQNVEAERIAKISLLSSTGLVVLTRTDQGWTVGQPAADLADDSNVEPVVSAVHTAVMGTVISENKDNFDKYNVQASSAIRLRVFLSNETAPALDGYIGRTGPSYTDSYFRFEGKDAVYVAGDMPLFLFQRDENTYRVKKLFKRNLDQATGFSIRSGKTEVSIQKSSDVWMNVKTSTAVNEAWMNELRAKINAITPAASATVLVSSQTLQFESSAVSLSVSWEGVTKTAVMGPAKGIPPAIWSAQIDDRPLAFTVPPDTVKALMDFLKQSI